MGCDTESRTPEVRPTPPVHRGTVPSDLPILSVPGVDTLPHNRPTRVVEQPEGFNEKEVVGATHLSKGTVSLSSQEGCHTRTRSGGGRTRVPSETCPVGPLKRLILGK